jgi:hypothetical protein
MLQNHYRMLTPYALASRAPTSFLVGHAKL